MSSSITTQVRFAITLLASALLAVGCSSSSNTGPGVTDTDGENVSGDSTRVDFEITVPAYVSDALQVRLEWSVKDEPGTSVGVAGTWIGDEFWAATGDLLTDTEHLLIVSFSDRNGDVTLGHLETEFKTGTNASESLQIEADQFDTGSWDDDGDGVSNIDELIRGTDPLFDETAELPVRESFHDLSIPEALDALTRVSGYYESSVPGQRPYNQNIERPQTENCLSGALGLPTVRIIDIDESGSGSFSETYFCENAGDSTSVEMAASRTGIDRSVTWLGTYDRTDSSSGVFDRIGFTTETELIDDRTRRQVGTIGREFLIGGSYRAKQDISYSLTGEIIDNSSQCEPIAGTITNDQQIAYVAVTTITKDAGERYWRVSVANEGQMLDEYLVQSLGTSFYCAFGG